jgi:hypothetical protein
MHESEWQLRITDYCDQLHLKWHHETDSRRTREGWPDLVIAGPGGIAIVELKTDEKRSKVSPGQKAWLDVLYDAPTTGVLVDVWRPRHWTSKVMPELRRLAVAPKG